MCIFHDTCGSWSSVNWNAEEGALLILTFAGVTPLKTTLKRKSRKSLKRYYRMNPPKASYPRKMEYINVESWRYSCMLLALWAPIDGVITKDNIDTATNAKACLVQKGEQGDAVAASTVNLSNRIEMSTAESTDTVLRNYGELVVENAQHSMNRQA